MIQESPLRFSSRARVVDAVSWAEWGPDAFALAAAEARPILLYLTVRWGDACRVADATTLADPRVVDRLRHRVVGARVDADERPDIAARYGDGSWPAVLLLTPDGAVIRRADAASPEALLGAIDDVCSRWPAAGDAVAALAAVERAKRQDRMLLAIAGGLLSPEMLDRALESVLARADARDGGFVPRAADPGAPREHEADAIRLLLYAHRRRGDVAALAHARLTLESMAEGAIFDAADGGFFRVSDPPGWDAPRPEKRACDQGALLLAIGELALVDADARERLEPIVLQTVRFLDRVLGEAGGGFRSSQEPDPVYFARDRAGRDAHGVPDVDRRVFASWTAMVARGLMQCGVAFDRREWTERGLLAVDFLVREMRAGEAGVYHAWDGAPRVLGLLADQSETLMALLHAYEVSGQPGYFEHATVLARVMEREWREPGSVFLDTAALHDESGLLAEPRAPLADNAQAAEGFLWLGRLTHDERHLRTAHEVLTRFAGALSYDEPGVEAYARVADRMLSIEPEVKVIAETPPGEPDRVADPLLRAALRLPLAARTVQRLHIQRDAELISRLGLPGDRPRVAYVCAGTSCSPPCTEPDQLQPLAEAAALGALG